MKNFGKAIGLAGLCVLFVMPAVAQIANGVDFTTTFPFYVGNTKMPAGAYSVSQSDLGQGLLEIRDKNAAHSAFIDFTPTQSEQAHPKSDVTFKKYGTTEFLSQIWVAGQTFGMEIEPTKAEKKLAEANKPVSHSVSGKAK